MRICTPWLEPEDYPRLLGRPFTIYQFYERLLLKLLRVTRHKVLIAQNVRSKISKDAGRFFPKALEDIYRRLSDFKVILTLLAFQCLQHLVQQLEVKKAHVLGLLFSEYKK